MSLASQQQQKGGQGQKGKGQGQGGKGGQGGQGKGQGQGGKGGQGGQGGKGQNQGGKGQGGQGQFQGGPPRKAPDCETGVIFAVPSGDSVVILPHEQQVKDPQNPGPLKEVNFTLTGLKAPAIGKKNTAGVTADAPYAWESREFLRKLLIGKTVVYRVEHELEGGVRAYGDLWLDTENVREKIIQNGWAEVSVKEKKPAVDKEGKELPPREPRADEVILTQLMEIAKKEKKGLWKNAPTTPAALKTVRQINYHDAATRRDEADASAALFAFYEANRGRTLQGVVEQVRTGSTLRVYIPSTRDEITVNLSGIHSPVYRFGDESACDPFSREAKFFTEYRLLNRDVQVTLETMDKTNNLYGTVLDIEQQRNIASALLSRGLASFLDWNCPADKAKEWQNLEAKARSEKLRMFSVKPVLAASSGNTSSTTTTTTTSSVPSAASHIGVDQFVGTVVEVISAGSLVVRVAKPSGGTSDVTVAFSSIRVPRLPPVQRKEKPADPAAATDAAVEEDDEPVAPLVTSTVVASTKGGKGADAKLSAAEAERIEAAYAKEAKEFLRKELIGKTVTCVKDYVDDGPKKPNAQLNNRGKKLAPRPPRAMYSVYQGKTNIALKLLRKGFARVSFLADSDPRSAEYKEMVMAEKLAEKEKLGLYGLVSKAPVQLVNDLAFEGEAKCRHFLGSLQRIGRVPAVVEYNFGPSRFKVFIPTQGLTISFALKGLLGEKPVKTVQAKPAAGQAPPPPLSFKQQYPTVDAEGNPIPANVAMQFTRDTLFQRDVTIQVEDIDMQGTFFGSLQVGGTNFALQLVEQGHAKLHHKSAEKMPGYDTLKKAEEKARNAKKGLWWNFDPVVEEARLAKLRADRQASRAGTGPEGADSTNKVAASRKFSVTVTEIMTGSNFFFQIADEETKSFMEDLMQDFQTRGWQNKDPYTPSKKGEWVAGQFTVDNSWYRAQVIRILPAEAGEEKQFELRYLDYGNSEIVTSANIRALDAEFTKTPAQAHKGKLAYIKAPQLDAEFGDDAAILFKELVWGKTLVAKLQYQDDNVYHVILGDTDSEVTINGALVMQGLASLEPKRKAVVLNDKIYQELQTQEQTARSQRICIWQYGVVPDSDEERQWANMLK